MNKFQRMLWSINGVLIFIVFSLGGFFILKNILTSDSIVGPKLIVGGKFEKAKIQGLKYSAPFQAAGSKGYILAIQIKTFDSPNEGDVSFGQPYGRRNTGEYFNAVNLLFLDDEFKVISKLLDKKGFIKSFNYPKHIFSEEDRFRSDLSDTTIHYLSYLIAFEDSNNDGLLDAGDSSDLYLSDLEGRSLTKVTNGINVSDYRYLTANEILIEYYKRESKSQEHQRKYFAKYYINEKKFEDLTQIHETLDAIEKELIK